MSWGEAPEPELHAGEVLVEVDAAGVNRADLLQRAGGYAPPGGAPNILGLECAGTIAALGDGVEGWAVGDRVCALLAGGGYAERVAVPAGQLLPAPRRLDAAGAAALPEAVCTVYSNLSMIARLDDPSRLGAVPTPTVLVHGGSSGVGTIAIPWARAIGARVLVTVGSSAKADRIRSLGADIIDYKSEDFVERTLALTDGRGADVVLDIVGLPYLARNVEALAPEGHLVLLGGEIADAEAPLSALRAKRGSLTVSMLRARSAEQKARIVAAVRENVWPLVESGDVSPLIDRVVPITDAASAHAALEAGEVVGKVVLAVR